MGPDTNLETDLYNQVKPSAAMVRPLDRQHSPGK